MAAATATSNFTHGHRSSSASSVFKSIQLSPSPGHPGPLLSVVVFLSPLVLDLTIKGQYPSANDAVQWFEDGLGSKFEDELDSTG